MAFRILSAAAIWFVTIVVSLYIATNPVMLERPGFGITLATLIFVFGSTFVGWLTSEMRG